MIIGKPNERFWNWLHKKKITTIYTVNKRVFFCLSSFLATKRKRLGVRENESEVKRLF